ncbi:hypothetical protein Ct61P_11158 [Colletotrichum tofieldiae]|nr:hypothetical protein Ct61P_11158 [Colletotrichum tofieldiae]
MTRQRHLALHLAALAALSTILPGTGPPGAAAVEDLEAEDVPPECVQVCTPIAQLTARCEAQAEQRFGTDRRWIGQRQVVGGLEREARGRRGKRRSLQRMLGTRLGRRQEGQDESYDSDDSDDEGAATQPRPAPGNAAVGTGQSEAANEAAAESVMRACVCGERGFDVAGAAFGCAACVAQNGTAVEANEDHRRVRLRRRAGTDDDGGNDAAASSARACDKHSTACVTGAGRVVYFQHNDGSTDNSSAAAAAVSAEHTPYYPNLFNIASVGRNSGYSGLTLPDDVVAAAGRNISDAEFRIGHARHGVRDAFVQHAAVYRLAERCLVHSARVGRREPDERCREGVGHAWWVVAGWEGYLGGGCWFDFDLR